MLAERMKMANLKALVIGRWNMAIVAASCIAIPMLIASWLAAMSYEKGDNRRYAACALGLFFQVAATYLCWQVMKQPPNLTRYYAHQVLLALALMLTAISMGMNNVVVNMCTRGTASSATLCGAHLAEFFAELLVCVCMGVSFLTTQQRIVVYIDKGIIDGIKGRTNDMQQLPP